MNGYSNNEVCGRYGGLSEVRIVAAKDVLDVVYDKISGCFTEVVLVAGVTAAKYEFEEDTAFYRQTLTGVYPFEKVVHELSFRLPVFGSDAVSAIVELSEVGFGGFVAVVVTSAGDAFVAGWSTEFEEEAPLKLVSILTDSCADYADDSFCTVLFSSEDVSFSRPFTGKLK